LGVGLGRNASDDAQRNGLIAFAIGAVLTVTGIFVYRSSSSSSVTQQPTEGPKLKEPWAPEQSKATMLPSWTRAWEGAIPAATFPVLLQREF
jgi:hypothetical protein